MSTIVKVVVGTLWSGVGSDHWPAFSIRGMSCWGQIGQLFLKLIH